jgi:hypothetical protein
MNYELNEPVAMALEAALTLPEASFVIHRRGLLVEFKTDLLLERVSLKEHGEFRSWQVGANDDHHCHPDLSSVRRIQFDAEAVECQGGRLNYTVWFLSSGDCGNPHRPDGLFSVTLNMPYDDEGQVRTSVLQPMFRLYDQLRSLAVVEASSAFLNSYRSLGAVALS